MLSELDIGAKKFKEQIPDDSPFGPTEGVFLEIVLSPGTEVTGILQKNQMQVGATKLAENGERIVGLYVPEKSMPILRSILEDYGFAPS